MVKCLWCHAYIPVEINIISLLSFKPIEPFPRCKRCDMELVALSECTLCRGCSRIQESEDLCEDCIRWQKLYPDRMLSHRAIYNYQGLITDVLFDYKYRNNYQRAEFFSQEMYQAIKSMRKEFDKIVPIPSSKNSLERRGFNPVAGLLDRAGVPYVDVLENTFKGQKQAEKDRKGRMESKQPFALVGDVNKQRILLVDDVYTTGRTIYHAYDALEKGGACKIMTLTLAR